MVTLLTAVYHAKDGITYEAGANVSFSSEGEVSLIDKGMAKPFEEEKKTKVLEPELTTAKTRRKIPKVKK